ncbi:acetyl-CoA carboxylase biotin carboxylase subunit [Weissella beninensis]|uniref:biotin carboxylase n=1 Tax=Periweissella beninensis TaxID=504936 RepID=A0ABT0VF83_9LACO|nr:acetyl-CoA carboxylase biotin carboxylase subunit [Periweissella beninensis]MBM7543524.1 acetyl-CoA carboxylase biotin carboxylase subunit [Periweissella beninensis]MCM2436506.1 acetyl-CoA carboxylase biotin carboxylase subunit [Periweissella beninensis]
MFKKVLIANRGDIATRMVRVLREMHIASVAVYSTVDHDSLHVQLADEAICIGGPRPADSYLNMQNILSAAVITGAEAIYPGYGFLSENALFAQMVADLNLTFIGPKPKTINLMGNKANAREYMRKNGIPVIPGSIGFLHDANEALSVANEVGYPVLLKAAAGGGGKGMRLINAASDLNEKFLEAQTEAQKSFGNKAMYLEKVLTDVEHIEVQILRDNFGNAVYLPERNCSLQRSNQKVLEESPAVGISVKQRTYLGELAVKAADALDYCGTGTIEFLMDHDQNFYFMEMNTRIQVEHPVTEMVTNLDLLALQIKIAANEQLMLTQNDIKINGHAIEVRLNAEEPEYNFKPSAGKIDYLYLPVGGNGVRIDTDLYQGAKVQPFYDSMIGKVIAHGRNRQEALERLQRLSDELIIQGIKTNIKFHQALLADQHVQNGIFNTKYLEQHFMPTWKREVNDENL